MIKLNADGGIPFRVTIDLTAYLPEGADPSIVTREQALRACREHLIELGGSNDGSEILANGWPELVE